MYDKKNKTSGSIEKIILDKSSVLNENEQRKLQKKEILSDNETYKTTLDSPHFNKNVKKEVINIGPIDSEPVKIPLVDETIKKTEEKEKPKIVKPAKIDDDDILAELEKEAKVVATTQKTEKKSEKTEKTKTIPEKKEESKEHKTKDPKKTKSLKNDENKSSYSIDKIFGIIKNKKGEKERNKAKPKIVEKKEKNDKVKQESDNNKLLAKVENKELSLNDNSKKKQYINRKKVIFGSDNDKKIHINWTVVLVILIIFSSLCYFGNYEFQKYETRKSIISEEYDFANKNREILNELSITMNDENKIISDYVSNDKADLNNTIKKLTEVKTVQSKLFLNYSKFIPKNNPVKETKVMSDRIFKNAQNCTDKMIKLIKDKNTNKIDLIKEFNQYNSNSNSDIYMYNQYVSYIINNN